MVDLRVTTDTGVISIVGTIRGKDIPDGYEEVEMNINCGQAVWLRRNLKKLIEVVKDRGE